MSSWRRSCSACRRPIPRASRAPPSPASSGAASSPTPPSAAGSAPSTTRAPCLASSATQGTAKASPPGSSPRPPSARAAPSTAACARTTRATASSSSASPCWFLASRSPHLASSSGTPSRTTGWCCPGPSGSAINGTGKPPCSAPPPPARVTTSIATADPSPWFSSAAIPAQRECHLKMIGQEQVPRVMGGHVWPEVFSVKLMILVDRAGSQWPVTGHAPWNGCNLADLVLPFVLFSVGMGFPLSLKANSCRCWTSEEVVISCCTKNRGTIGNKIVANLVYVQII